MTKQQALDKVNEEIMTCKICPIGKSGKPVVGEGCADADVVFIGEAPGKQEAVSGRPFIGRSGMLLRSLIREVGLQEEDVYITSPVKYLPHDKDGTPGGTPSSSDIAHGRIHLMKQLNIIKPKIVVLLGRVSAEGVLERKVAVVSEHGEVIEERDGVKYFLTIHPSAALRFSLKYKPLLEEDFKRLKTFIA
jgi:uracil-DNA glycosylase family 4